jgi:redox-sensitive bicupin YhaK (pirin superfamily)
MSTINEVNLQPETIRVRWAEERGHAQYDWLDTWHTFSFDTRGSVDLDGYTLATSDGAAVSGDTALLIRAAEPAEVMLFDLP